MEATESNLKVKLAQLQLTTKRTDNIIASDKHEAIQRQCQTLSTISNEINVMRITVEAEKIGMKVGVEEIVEWNNDIETKLDEADKEIEKARKWIGDYKKKAEAEAQEEELKFQEKLHQTKLKYEAENYKLRNQRKVNMSPASRQLQPSVRNYPSWLYPSLTVLTWTGHDSGVNLPKQLTKA